MDVKKSFLIFIFTRLILPEFSEYYLNLLEYDHDL